MRKIYFQNLLTKFLFLCLLLSSITAFSQNGVITGTVKASNGDPIPGVLVAQKDSKNQTLTDLDGKYKITVKTGNKVLVFSALGLVTKEVSAVSSVINVTLEDDLKKLDEVVVIGYGTQLRSENLAAVSSIKGTDIQQITPVNAFDAIQGRLAGVQILSNGGPGEGSEIKIRGISTIQAGADPLYVVDGQQLENIDNLNPNDIESIEVIKDGASAAIYGSKSANGVVMITTKKGKEGEKPKIDLSYVNTYSYVYNKIPVANSRQRYDFEKLRNTGNVVDPDLDSLSLLKRVSTDLQNELLRGAKRNDLNLSFRGGTKASDYYFSTSYLNDKGVIIGTNYDRFNSNLNLNFKISDFISSGSRILLSYEKQSGADEVNVFRTLSWRQPNLLVRDNDGELFPYFGGRSNPLAYALLQTNDRRQLKGTVFNYAEFKILKSLTLKSTLGVNFGLDKRNSFTPSTILDNQPTNGFERQGEGYDVQQENYLNYSKKVGKNSFTGLLGFSFQKWRSENANLYATAFISDIIPTFNNVATLDLARTNSSISQHALASQFSRFGYDYDKRYFLNATVRRDGSSRFGKDNTWAVFPAISLGWIVTKEKFMAKISKNALTNMKLRAGYSINGNERIDDYGSLYLYAPGEYYAGISGYGPNQFASPNLKWESTENINIGTDLEFLKGRINASFDYYTKTTKDLLYDAPVPEEYGVNSTYLANIGSIQNKGLEIDINAIPVKLKGFSWRTGFNIGFNKNKVLSLGNPAGFEQTAGTRGGNVNYLVRPGSSLGDIYGFRNLGIYAYDQSNAYNDAGQRLTPNFNAGVFTNYTINGQPYTGTVRQLKAAGNILKGGDIIWEDQNGDFNIDAQNDRTIIGNGLAKSSGGFFNEFKYKNYSLSFLFDFNLGNQIYQEYESYRNSMGGSTWTPSPLRIDGSWRNQGDITSYPTLISTRPQNRIGASSEYVSNADYVKLRNVRVNYTLPKELFKKITWVNNISLNLSANNLLTFTNYAGYNPELGSRGNNLTPGYDELRYPNKTSLIFGLKVGL